MYSAWIGYIPAPGKQPSRERGVASHSPRPRRSRLPPTPAPPTARPRTAVVTAIHRHVAASRRSRSGTATARLTVSAAAAGCSRAGKPPVASLPIQDVAVERLPIQDLAVANATPGASHGDGAAPSPCRLSRHTGRPVPSPSPPVCPTDPTSGCGPAAAPTSAPASMDAG
eukprot:scaffold14475_cov107-Isochrysis_galbana.AAC.7